MLVAGAPGALGFVKGLAIGAAGLGIATILPGGIITAAAADKETKRPDMNVHDCVVVGPAEVFG